MAFTKVATIHELPSGTGKPLVVGGRKLALFNVEGTYHAIDDTCPHMGASLSDGYVENGIVTCPWHAWRWDPKTGAADGHPDQKLKTYPIKVENGEVFVDLG